jgi:predicted TIM-barrel fold metal-dependent hydrolase
MIIDANVHISLSGKWYHTAHDSSLTRLRENVKEAKIDKAIVVPLPGLIGNQEQQALIGDDPSLVSACTFNPASYQTPQEAAEAFRKEFSERKKTFVKFHNRFGKYHPMDERFLAVIDANDSLPVPMVIGVCGLLHDRNIEAAVNTPIYFFDLAKRMKNSILMIMHGGGSQILQVAEMCRDLQHVYFDLSMTLSKYQNTSVSGDISWLCHHYDRRMIWGSDFPEVSIAEALQHFDVSVGKLAAEKRDNILGENLRKLLDLA